MAELGIPQRINPELLGSPQYPKLLDTFGDVMIAADKGWLRGQQMGDAIFQKPGRDALEKETVEAKRQQLRDLEEIRPLANEANRKKLEADISSVDEVNSLHEKEREVKNRELDDKLKDPYGLNVSTLESAQKLGINLSTKENGEPDFDKIKKSVSDAQALNLKLLQQKAARDGYKVETIEVLNEKGDTVKKIATFDPNSGKIIGDPVELGVSKRAKDTASSKEQLSSYAVLLKAGKPDLAFDDEGNLKSAQELAAIIPTVNSAKKGKDLVAGELQILNSLDQAEKDLGTLEKMFNDAGPGYGGPVSGRAKGVLGGLDTTTAAINNARISATPNLARGVFREVGVLTDKDVERYAKLLPSPNDTPELRTQKFAQLKQRLNEGRKLTIENLSKAGRNVSEFKDKEATPEEKPLVPDAGKKELLNGKTFEVGKQYQSNGITKTYRGNGQFE